MAKIGLDYGHGNDTFPPSKGVYKHGKAYHEHDFNSKLGLKIKKLLEDNGHEVIEAQPAYGKEVGLTTRTNLYNREKVDIVVSIHANAGTSNVSGRCAFYWHTSKEGKRLAGLIINAMKDMHYSTHGNGLHQSKTGSWTNLHICRETNMPAVLVENGFMTNEIDFKFIFGDLQEEYTDDLAKAYFKAIQAYFGESSVKDTPATKVDSVSTKKPKKKDKPKKKVSVKANLKVDGKWAELTTRALQEYFGTPVDDIISNQLRNSITEAFYGNTIDFNNSKKGSTVIKALQKLIGAKQDGLLGPATIRALQKYLGTVQDGKLSRPSLVVKELQRRLNAGNL